MVSLDDSERVRILYNGALLVGALVILAYGWLIHTQGQGDLDANSFALSFWGIGIAVLIYAGDAIARVFSDAATRETRDAVDDIKRMSAETASKVDRLMEMSQRSPPAIVINQNGAMSPTVVIQNGAARAEGEQDTSKTDIAADPGQTTGVSSQSDE